MEQKTKVKKRTNQTIVLRIKSDKMLRFGTGLLKLSRATLQKEGVSSAASATLRTILYGVSSP
jgi:hypothetical protein